MSDRPHANRRESVAPDAGAEAPQPSRFRFSSEISLGSLLTGLIALIGLIAWAVTSANRGDQSQRDQIVLQAQVTEKLADLRSAVSTGLQELRTQIAGLPDQRASLVQTERRLTELEQRFQSGDVRFGVLERSAIESRADLNQLLRAAQMPLPKTR